MKTLKVLVIAGHGAGDPGAVALNFKEADLTRDLANVVVDKLSNYAIVYKYDTYKNLYKELKAGKSFNFTEYDYVTELHFNTAVNDKNGDGNTTGTEILVHASEKGVSVEEAILKNFKAIGFKNRGVKRRSDLLVMNTCKKQGVSYALIETCFMDDADDMKLYTYRKAAVADAIVNGIVDGFGLSKELTVDQAIDKFVAAGIINTPDYWRKTVKSVKHLDTLLIKIAKTL